MSYDLYLKPRNGRLDAGEFQAYFRDRRNYDCDGNTAVYHCNDTGVYFSFEFDENTPNVSGYPITFNINYVRPSFFALEAEPQLSALISTFDLMVHDPQMNGMGTDDYSPEKFIEGWRRGNQFGYESVFDEPSSRRDVHHLPVEKLTKVWKWNSTRSQLQTTVGQGKYVPLVFFLNVDNKTVTASVWPDGIPIITPKVDYFFVARQDLAPRSLFSKKHDTILVDWHTASPILAKFGSQSPDGTMTLDYDSPPKEVASFIRSQRAKAYTGKGISPDRVLETELFSTFNEDA
jgi:hypothetical protein